MTSRRSQRTFGARTAKAVFSCSLLFGAISWGQGPNAPDAARKDPVALAKEIKRSPVYRDPGIKEDSNWLSGATDRLSKIDLSSGCRETKVPASDATALGTFLTIAMWSILGAAVVVFLYFAIKHFVWSRNLERRAKAMLEDDEPDRTVDEWLMLCDNLEREGRFREAVRCLYLASLLKIDEARIARFERGQTNWEHLARIQASPKLPPSLDFVPPTKAFDEIWYGMRTNGKDDVDRFRHWYRHVLDSTRAKAA